MIDKFRGLIAVITCGGSILGALWLWSWLVHIGPPTFDEQGNVMSTAPWWWFPYYFSIAAASIGSGIAGAAVGVVIGEGDLL